MVGMLVLSGGGAWDGCCPKSLEQIDLFWNLVFSRRGPEDPHLLGGTFQLPVVIAKGPEGPYLLVVPNPGLVLAATGLEGPHVFVSCQNVWGTWEIRTGARDVRRTPYYYVVGYSGIHAGGQVQS